MTWTQHGIHAHLPVVELSSKHAVADLLCSDNDMPLWLFLHRPHEIDSRNERTEGPKAFHCSLACDSHFRLARPTKNWSTTMNWRWQEITISPRPTFRAHAAVPAIISNSTWYHYLARVLDAGMHAPFRIRPAMFAELHHRSGWALHAFEPRVELPWGGLPYLTLVFRRRSDPELGAEHTCIALTLGRCVATAAHAADSMRAPSFVSVRFFLPSGRTGDHREALEDVDLAHLCEDEHVDRWRGGVRVFAADFADAAGVRRVTESVTVSVKRSWLNYITRLPAYDLHITGNNVCALVSISFYRADERSLCRRRDEMPCGSSVRAQSRRQESLSLTLDLRCMTPNEMQRITMRYLSALNPDPLWAHSSPRAIDRTT